MSLYKKLLVAGITMMAGVTLTGCLDSGVSANSNPDTIASSRLSYQKAKKENTHWYSGREASGFNHWRNSPHL